MMRPFESCFVCLSCTAVCSTPALSRIGARKATICPCCRLRRTKLLSRGRSSAVGPVRPLLGSISFSRTAVALLPSYPMMPNICLPWSRRCICRNIPRSRLRLVLAIQIPLLGMLSSR
ncbi:ORF10 [Chimpanzee stool associated circular ssDNA virus]|nr:ORF10 [Chimpanzee stool associated circular ssDNA virus]